MSNPYHSKAKDTDKAKMKHMGVSGEYPQDRANRIAKGYADGGSVKPPVTAGNSEGTIALDKASGVYSRPDRPIKRSGYPK